MCAYNSWTPLTSFPTPRSSHTLVLYNNLLIMFGGSTESAKHNDLYTYDIITKQSWKKESTTGINPIRVSGHSAVVKDSKMYVFGGFNMTH